MAKRKWSEPEEVENSSSGEHSGSQTQNIAEVSQKDTFVIKLHSKLLADVTKEDWRIPYNSEDILDANNGIVIPLINGTVVVSKNMPRSIRFLMSEGFKEVKN